MITDAHVATFAAMAGPDFRWDTPNAPKQLDSRHRQGLVILLASMQAGLCVACGDALAGERVDLCHIVASRISGRGVMPGNTYIGHSGCNDDDAKAFGDIVPIRSLAMPELVAMSHPTRKECLAASAEYAATRKERLAYRQSLM